MVFPLRRKISAFESDILHFLLRRKISAFESDILHFLRSMATDVFQSLFFISLLRSDTLQGQ